jgi:hypothetical protein
MRPCGGGPAVSAPTASSAFTPARVLSQSAPWIAEEAGIFKKYNLDFSARLYRLFALRHGGDARRRRRDQAHRRRGNIAPTSGRDGFRLHRRGQKRADAQHLAGPAIKTPEDLRRKRSASTASAAARMYFTVQALRQKGLDPAKDVQLIQSGGSPGTLAALVSGSLDAACLNPARRQRSAGARLHYVIYGPDQRYRTSPRRCIPQAGSRPAPAE